MDRAVADLDVRETILPTPAGDIRAIGWQLHPALRPFVLRHGAFIEPCGGPIRRELPMVGSPLILTAGTPYLLSRSSDPAIPVQRLTGFIAGLHRTYTTSQATGRTEAFQIDLTPLAARRFVHGPMREICDRLLPVADLFDGTASGFEDRIWNAGDWPARIRILEQSLIDRLAPGEPEHPAMAWLWRQLQAHDARLDLATTAAELGWSHKHLIAQSHAWFGMSPKPIARQLRFERAVRIIRSPPRGGTFADLAARLGYADQSHFTREFRAFAGIPPAQFVAEDRANGIVLADA